MGCDPQVWRKLRIQGAKSTAKTKINALRAENGGSHCNPSTGEAEAGRQVWATCEADSKLKQNRKQMCESNVK